MKKEKNMDIEIKFELVHFSNCYFNAEYNLNTPENKILATIRNGYKRCGFKKLAKILPYDTYLYLKELVYMDKIPNEYIFDENMRYKQEFIDLLDLRIIQPKPFCNQKEFMIDYGLDSHFKKVFENEDIEYIKNNDEIARIIYSMILAYGVVEENFLVRQLSKILNKKFTNNQFKEILSFNIRLFMNCKEIENVTHKVTYITHLDPEEFLDEIEIIMEIHNKNKYQYKEFTKEEILEMDKHFLNSKDGQRLARLALRNASIDKQDEFYANLEAVKLNNPDAHYNLILMYNNKYNFENVLYDWISNTPSYYLLGYSPNEINKL